MRYLHEYAAERARFGATDFAMLHGKPALIGVGMLGDIQKAKAAPISATYLAIVRPEDQLADEIVGRVWLVRLMDPRRRAGPDVLIGRDLHNDIVIPEHSISRRQASIRCDGDRAILIDLNSSNGTYLNHERLPKGKPCRLANGDTVRFGRLSCTFLTRQGFLASVANLAGAVG